MQAVLGLLFLLIALSYGFCFAVRPEYATPGSRRVADWTYRQPLLLRCGVAFAVWIAFMTGVLFFARGTG